MCVLRPEVEAAAADHGMAGLPSFAENVASRLRNASGLVGSVNDRLQESGLLLDADRVRDGLTVMGFSTSARPVTSVARAAAAGPDRAVATTATPASLPVVYLTPVHDTGGATRLDVTVAEFAPPPTAAAAASKFDVRLLFSPFLLINCLLN